jgi:uncharacterized membrane protein YeiB
MSTAGSDPGVDDVSGRSAVPSDGPRRPIPSESVERLPGPDVVRAVALIGVVVMNSHGYLIIRGGDPGGGDLADLFDPWTGPLATRFAALFVLTAGVGVTLLTRRTVAASDAGRPGARAAVTAMRWRLARRGVFLYVLGQLLDVIWPGTIILYYGVMFVLAAFLFTLRSRWLVMLGVAAALAGWGIRMWVWQRNEDGFDTRWLTLPDPDSIRRFVFEVFVNGTHPLLPWLAFFCAGIVLGRLLSTDWWRPAAAGVGFVLVAGAALASAPATTPAQLVLLSIRPGDRGLVYVASALGTALIAYTAISWLTDRLAVVRPALIDPLRRAGQMSLTIYVAHILVFNLLVDWLDVIEPAGVGTALVFSAVFWTVAIAGAAAWHRTHGRGPLERVYRAFGG